MLRQKRVFCVVGMPLSRYMSYVNNSVHVNVLCSVAAGVTFAKTDPH